MIENITGIVLAGGKSRRIGTDKAFLKIGEKTIIEEIISKLKNIFKEILIVSNEVEKFNFLGVSVIKDIIPHKGPLGGIYTGLIHSKTFYNFFVACDMPFINLELIKYMKNFCNNFDVIAPKLKNGYEALHTIYSKNCVDSIEKQIKKDKLKITDFFSQVRVKEISEDIIKQFDTHLLAFFNINTESDYQQALNIAQHF